MRFTRASSASHSSFGRPPRSQSVRASSRRWSKKRMLSFSRSSGFSSRSMNASISSRKSAMSFGMSKSMAGIEIASRRRGQARREVPMHRTDLEEWGFDAERLARVRQAIVADIERERCHGVSLVVARGGKVVLELLEGFADRAARKQMSRDAVFATMSVGKQFTN